MRPGSVRTFESGGSPVQVSLTIGVCTGTSGNDGVNGGNRRSLLEGQKMEEEDGRGSVFPWCLLMFLFGSWSFSSSPQRIRGRWCELFACCDVDTEKSRMDLW
ncbi:hypothetical protein INR49_011930 [Caranx melampygus]|nr:hypothetical protein INR49_011930 [Caranx melampygus]